MANESEGGPAALGAERLALMTALAEIIEALPTRERAVFILRYVQRLPMEHVAQRLRISRAEAHESGERALASCRARMGSRLDKAPPAADSPI